MGWMMATESHGAAKDAYSLLIKVPFYIGTYIKSHTLLKKLINSYRHLNSLH